MTVQFFGTRWDAPQVDHAEQIPTPLGSLCYVCREPILEGERGLMRGCVRLDPDGKPCGSLEPVHTECEMLGIIGHMHGVCSCTGFDTSSRAAALELLKRLNQQRAEQGMGPL